VPIHTPQPIPTHIRTITHTPPPLSQTHACSCTDKIKLSKEQQSSLTRAPCISVPSPSWICSNMSFCLRVSSCRRISSPPAHTQACEVQSMQECRQKAWPTSCATAQTLDSTGLPRLDQTLNRTCHSSRHSATSVSETADTSKPSTAHVVKKQPSSIIQLKLALPSRWRGRSQLLLHSVDSSPPGRRPSLTNVLMSILSVFTFVLLT
jgi:hypothetical protein